MATEIDRQQLADALTRLGGEDDGDVLAAAREAQDVLTQAGVTWHDILVAAPAPAPAPAEEEEVEEDDLPEYADADSDNDEEFGEDDEMVPANDSGEGGKDNAETLKLIERMLAQAKDDEDFREELNGYKEDIAAGEFAQRDRQYVRDLFDRLRNT